ncbi:MAG: hypothetical protein QGH45_05065 [Myxococcota bacterium]|nr:hypothetical protein [Myxococcota bacterium]
MVWNSSSFRQDGLAQPAGLLGGQRPLVQGLDRPHHLHHRLAASDDVHVGGAAVLGRLQQLVDEGLGGRHLLIDPRAVDLDPHRRQDSQRRLADGLVHVLGERAHLLDDLGGADPLQRPQHLQPELLGASLEKLAQVGHRPGIPQPSEGLDADPVQFALGQQVDQHRGRPLIAHLAKGLDGPLLDPPVAVLLGRHGQPRHGADVL